MLEKLFLNIIGISLPVSLLIILLLLIKPLIRNSYIAKWRYFMWLFIAVRLMLPITVQLPRISVKVPVQQLTGEPDTLRHVAENIASASGQNESASISMTGILSLIWIAGLLFMLVRQGFQYWYFKKSFARWSSNITDSQTAEMFNEACNQMKVRRKIDIKSCKKVKTPMILGLLKPVLLLPDRSYNRDDLAVIFKHELIHLCRNDLLYKLLLLIVNTVYWFNPVIYYMTHAANQDIELVCDEEVIKGMDLQYKKHYCQTIVEAIHDNRSKKSVLSTCFNHGKESVRERLSSILNLQMKKKGIAMFFAVSLSVVAASGLIGFTSAQVTAEIIDTVVEADQNIYAPENIEAPSFATEQNDGNANEPAQPEKTEQTSREINAPPDNHSQLVMPASPALPAENQESVAIKATEPTVAVHPSEAPPRKESVKNKSGDIIVIPDSSYSFEASFKKKGQTASIAKEFQADSDMNMTISKKQSGGLVRVTNADTGQVIFDEAGLKTAGSLYQIPVTKGTGYKITVSSASDGDTVRLYIYGADPKQ